MCVYGAPMTLDVLFHLMKVLSPEKNTSDGNISALITLLSSEKNRSEALSPLIHRLHLLSFAQSVPGNAEQLLSAHLPKEDGTLPCLTSRTGPGCVMPIQVKFRRQNQRTSIKHSVTCYCVNTYHVGNAPEFCFKWLV